MTETHRKAQHVLYAPMANPTQMVGRQWEVALIMEHYETARKAHTCIVIGHGRAWDRKTCLLDEIAGHGVCHTPWAGVIACFAFCPSFLLATSTNIS